ncbi:MAG: hypothetical protein A2297_08110 [Elusimicrobia bacterium RIFOXYB2_FULL_48_7]|nr:MAG: hypothetical protein A2297_08110 [Elusimicrobia bacterium RIFOXYB2_FULL_48_7]
MKNRKLLVLLVLLLALPSFVYSKTRTADYDNFPASGFRLGLGYPYLALRYKAVELKYFVEQGMDVYGARVNLTLLRRGSINLYTGLEADLINFNTEDIQGTGEVILPFIGSELFLSDRVSFFMDLGPGSISVKDSMGYEGSVSGLEWIINTGLWIYF